MYLEQADDWVRMWKLTDLESYPVDGPGEIVQLEASISDGELRTFFRRGQDEAKAEQRADPSRRAIPQSAEGRSWNGRPLQIQPGSGSIFPRLGGRRPADGPGQWIRDRRKALAVLLKPSCRLAIPLRPAGTACGLPMVTGRCHWALKLTW